MLFGHKNVLYNELEFRIEPMEACCTKKYSLCDGLFFV